MNILEESDFQKLDIKGEIRYKLLYTLKDGDATRLIKAERVLQHLERLKENIVKEMRKIENGQMEMPPTCPPQQVDVIEGILEGRYEYLENFYSTVDFILTYPERGHQV